MLSTVEPSELLLAGNYRAPSEGLLSTCFVQVSQLKWLISDKLLSFLPGNSTIIVDLFRKTTVKISWEDGQTKSLVTRSFGSQIENNLDTPYQVPSSSTSHNIQVAQPDEGLIETSEMDQNPSSVSFPLMSSLDRIDLRTSFQSFRRSPFLLKSCKLGVAIFRRSWFFYDSKRVLVFYWRK